MSQMREPTNAQLYEAYPGYSASPTPGQTVAHRDTDALERRLAQLEQGKPRERRQGHAQGTPGYGPMLALAIVTIALSVPLSAIALASTGNSFVGLVALAITWAGIVAVNAIFARFLRGRPD